MIRAVTFEVRSVVEPGGVLLSPMGDLDMATVPALADAVEDSLRREPARVLIDLREVGFVDSSGLRLLLELYARSGSEGWDLALTRPSAYAWSVFEVSGTDGHLPFISASPDGRGEDSRPAGVQIAADGAGPALAVSLPRGVRAPGLARSAVGELAAREGLPSNVSQSLALLVSEVVSNAVLHSDCATEEPVLMTASVTDEVVRVTVTDAGSGFTPVERDPGRVEGGYGLYLVEQVAQSWGVDAGGPTSVWFELPRDD